MSTTALIGAAAPSTALAGDAPPSIPELARSLIAAHTSGGHTDVQSLANDVAQTSAQLGGHDLHALANAVGDQLRAFSQSDASAFSRAEAAVRPTNTAGEPKPVTADQLRAIMPRAGHRAEDYVSTLNTAMAAHGIVTREQRAAFLGQVTVESGDLHSLSENLNHSTHSMMNAWRSRFPTAASTQPYLHHPEKLANHVYAGAGGNGDEASGDGYRFRGRGFIQVTGRATYRSIGHEADPDRLSDPAVAADASAAYWQERGLNARTEHVLDRHDFNRVSIRVNGGVNGLDERFAAYNRALAALR